MITIILLFVGIGVLLPSLPDLFSELLDFSFGEELSKRNERYSPPQPIPGWLGLGDEQEIFFSYVKKKLSGTLVAQIGSRGF